MAVKYWQKIGKLEMKYSCYYKIPLLIKEILFDLSFFRYNTKYNHNYNSILSFIHRKGLEFNETLEVQNNCYKCKIVYFISRGEIFSDERVSLQNCLFDHDVLLFLFSLNHKKIIYKGNKNNIDLKKLRQYVHVKKLDSLYLMEDFLFLQNSSFYLEPSIDTGDDFLNKILGLLQGLPFYVANGQAYRKFFMEHNIINQIINQDLQEEWYLYHLKEFVENYKRNC